MNASAGHTHAAGERFPPAPGQAVFTLPISSLRAGDSPRLGGEDTQHIRLLAESEAPLPPIVVHRATMRIIDGMHRLRVAHLRGRRTVDVVFFDGTEDEAFVMAVQANMAHGLPLCRADREAAAARLLTRDPRRSDRWIASIAGLSAGTVAAIRRRPGPGGGEPDTARIGQDGRVRPLNSAAGRQLARDAILQNPGASLREIATAAGISPTTVRDVRERLRRGEDPVPRPAATAGQGRPRREASPPPSPRAHRDREALLHQLRRDPSIRFTEAGRALLRWLVARASGPDRWQDVADAAPMHSAYIAAELARLCADEWREVADHLERRVRQAAWPAPPGDDARAGRGAEPAIDERSPTEMTRDEAEDRLLRIWCDVLQVAEVSPDANFFELSGASLQAVDLARRVGSELGRDVSIMDIFDFPSFAEFASRVHQAPELPGPAGPDPGHGPGTPERPGQRPSILQEQSLRVDATGPPSDHFLLRFGYLIRGPLDVARLSRAIDLLARRHELFRAAVGWRNGGAYLEILDETALTLQVMDAPVPPGRAPADHVRRVALQRPELTPTRDEPPLARLTLLRLGPGLHALVVAVDHIICDGFSIKLLVADISEIYGRLSGQPGFRPDDVPVPFTRWAAEQRARLHGENLSRLVDHWRAVLGDDPGILSPPLPWSDLCQDGAQTYTREFGDPARREFAAAARRHRMSPFSVGLSALGTSVAEITGPDRACLTTTWVNRDVPAHLQVFGPVSHDVYLRLPIDPGLPPGLRLDTARAAIHDALDHAEIPGLVLYQQLWPASSADPTLQPSVYVTVGERWAAGFRLDGTETQGLEIDASASDRDLTCEFIVEKGTVSRIEFSSASSGITPGFMGALADRIEANLGEAAGRQVNADRHD
jgi:ParB-like chromosome segregation protein Spo0J